ncbi:MAG: hypothetical protein WAO89_00590, partial [Kiritimatiellia bacterium]
PPLYPPRNKTKDLPPETRLSAKIPDTTMARVLRRGLLRAIGHPKIHFPIAIRHIAAAQQQKPADNVRYFSHFQKRQFSG